MVVAGYVGYAVQAFGREKIYFHIELVGSSARCIRNAGSQVCMLVRLSGRGEGARRAGMAFVSGRQVDVERVFTSHSFEVNYRFLFLFPHALPCYHYI